MQVPLPQGGHRVSRVWVGVGTCVVVFFRPEGVTTTDFDTDLLLLSCCVKVYVKRLLVTFMVNVPVTDWGLFVTSTVRVVLELSEGVEEFVGLEDDVGDREFETVGE